MISLHPGEKVQRLMDDARSRKAKQTVADAPKAMATALLCSDCDEVDAASVAHDVYSIVLEEEPTLQPNDEYRCFYVALSNIAAALTEKYGRTAV